MGRKAFVDSGTNTETLVNEWLRRTKRKKLAYSDLEVYCRRYWIDRGIRRTPGTYTRAFRRLRELNEKMFVRKANGYKVTRSPKKIVFKVRHDRDKFGDSYSDTTRLNMFWRFAC